MPLTAAEKNQLMSSGIQAGIASLSAQAGLTALGTSALGIAALPLLLGLQQQLNRVRFPQIKLGQLQEVIDIGGELARRGLEPVVSRDPFSFDVLVGTAGQDLPLLAQEAFERRIGQEIGALEAPRILAEREALIEGLRETAVERGFFETTADIPADLRGGVFRPTPSAPLQFVQTGGAPL